MKLLYVAVLLMVGAAGAAAQNDAGGQPFARTFPFAVDKPETLAATIGPVKVTTFRITNLGRGYGRGGLLRRPDPPSELSTTLRLEFQVDNPADEEWRVTFTVEFLDKGGTVIDRVSQREDYEEEQENFRIEHPLLEYVLPLTANVRVTIEGRRL